MQVLVQDLSMFVLEFILEHCRFPIKLSPDLSNGVFDGARSLRVVMVELLDLVKYLRIFVHTGSWLLIMSGIGTPLWLQNAWKQSAKPIKVNFHLKKTSYYYLRRFLWISVNF